MVKQISPGKTKKLPPITCKGCGMSFIPNDGRQHYHSENCREAYYQRTYFSKATARKVCPNCGITFSTTKPGRQDYCTPECREEHKRKRHEDVAASVTAERATYLGDRFATLERDGHKCTYCGKGPQDSVRLDIEDDEKGGLRTICNLCLEGRKFNAVPNVEA